MNLQSLFNVCYGFMTEFYLEKIDDDLAQVLFYQAAQDVIMDDAILLIGVTHDKIF